jgi:DNA invertase Pin-like site-specific DNA recombinase
MVTRLDRLARSVADLQRIVATLKEKGCSAQKPDPGSFL